MKGRILFALMFAALMALGISSLNDLQAQKAALPLSERAAAHVAALPPVKMQSASVSAEKALPAPQISAPQWFKKFARSAICGSQAAFAFSAMLSRKTLGPQILEPRA